MADMNEVKYEETVLITGGSGLTGRYITSALLGNGFRVVHLSTRNSSFGKVRVHRWSPGEGILDPSVLEDADHIIHLAGANVGEKRWTRARKNEIMTSRTASARLIFETAIKEGFRFKSFISSSASGYYGTVNTGKIFSEDDRPGDDFLAMVGRQWEAEADRFSSIASRVVKIRTSVVLTGREGPSRNWSDPPVLVFSR
ncbi:MAG: NAD-dependent epimerase/dehydratase family protein [Bacteroidales bacterium]